MNCTSGISIFIVYCYVNTSINAVAAGSVITGGSAMSCRCLKN